MHESESTIKKLTQQLQAALDTNEQTKTSSKERHDREINRLTEKYTGEISDLQMTLSVERKQMSDMYSSEQTKLVSKYENQISELKKNFENVKQNMIAGQKHERSRWESGKYYPSDMKSRERWENLFQLEKEEIELKPVSYTHLTLPTKA